MMSIIFLFLLIAVLSAWYGTRRISLYFFSISFILAIAWFFHHVTATIGLSL